MFTPERRNPRPRGESHRLARGHRPGRRRDGVMGVTIHRSRHAQDYVVVPNGIARDKRLSFLARGLLVMLLSLPPDWHVTTDTLAEDNPDSRTGIRAAMRELREAGDVQLLAERGKDGRMRRHLEVFDTPQPNADTPRLVPPAKTPVPAGRTKRRIPTVGETAVEVSTGPKYGGEVQENRSRPASHDQDQDPDSGRVGTRSVPTPARRGRTSVRSAANSENHQVHHGPESTSPDDQQRSIPVTHRSPAADRNAHTRGAP